MILRRSFWLIFLAFACLAAGPPAKEEAEHKELRAVRDAMLRAFDKGDIDGLLEYVHPAVLTTWPNGETVRGRDAVRTFYERMLTDKDSTVRSMTTNLTTDDVSLVSKDKTAAVACGKVVNHFDLRDGKEFDLDSRWTAALVKDKGKWQVVAFHVGANVFDNGVLSLILRSAVMWTALGVGAIGLVVGAVAGVVFARRRSAGG